MDSIRVQSVLLVNSQLKSALKTFDSLVLQLQQNSTLDFSRVIEAQPGLFFQQFIYGRIQEIKNGTTFVQIGGRQGSFLIGNKQPGLILKFANEVFFYNQTSEAPFRVLFSMVEFSEQRFHDLLSITSESLFFRRRSCLDVLYQVQLKNLMNFLKVFKLGLINNKTRDVKKFQFNYQFKRPNHLICKFRLQRDGYSKNIVFLDLMNQDPKSRYSLNRSYKSFIKFLQLLKRPSKDSTECQFTSFMSTLIHNKLYLCYQPLVSSLQELSQGEVYNLLKLFSKIKAESKELSTLASPPKKRLCQIIEIIRNRIDESSFGELTQLQREVSTFQKFSQRCLEEFKNVHMKRSRFLFRSEEQLYHATEAFDSNFGFRSISEFMLLKTHEVMFVEVSNRLNYYSDKVQVSLKQLQSAIKGQDLLRMKVQSKSNLEQQFLRYLDRHVSVNFVQSFMTNQNIQKEYRQFNEKLVQIISFIQELRLFNPTLKKDQSSPAFTRKTTLAFHSEHQHHSPQHLSHSLLPSLPHFQFLNLDFERRQQRRERKRLWLKGVKKERREKEEQSLLQKLRKVSEYRQIQCRRLGVVGGSKFSVQY